MTRAEELRIACGRGDDVAVDRLGWRPVHDALRMWPRRLGTEDLVPYALALGDRDPEQLVAAIRGLALNEYRPSASQVLVALQGPEAPASRGARPDRPDLAPAALQAVRLAAELEEVCDCGVRAPAVVRDGAGVDRCPECGGLEIGQYETALETPAP
jgi:hypothetical protein